MNFPFAPLFPGLSNLENVNALASLVFVAMALALGGPLTLGVLPIAKNNKEKYKVGYFFVGMAVVFATFGVFYVFLAVLVSGGSYIVGRLAYNFLYKKGIVKETG